MATSCPECCNWYVVTTELPVNQTAELENCTCQVTLRKLFEVESNRSSKECERKEIVFQSGIHYLSGNRSMHTLSLEFSNLRSAVMRGQSYATISCLNQSLSFEFYHIPTVTIQNIHLNKCRDLRTNILTDNVVFVVMSHLQFTIEILNSTFTDTGMTLHTLSNDQETINGTVTVEAMIVENTVIDSYASDAVLYFEHRGHLLAWSKIAVSVMFKNVTASYNNRPFLQVSNFDETFVLLTGENAFIWNTRTIIKLDNYWNNLKFSRAIVSFINNSKNSDLTRTNPPIYINSGTMVFRESIVSFNNNDGGILAENTDIIFGDNVTIHFYNNNGLPNGGALSLDAKSTIIFKSSSLKTLLNFTNNTADKGGAIYVKDSRSIRPVFKFQCDPTLVEMLFSNNSALYGGNHIYGGWVDWTIDSESGNITYNSAINKSLNIDMEASTDIASCPVRICLCQNGHPNCTITNHIIEVYGYSASLSLVAVGQRYTPVAAYVIANLESDSELEEDKWQHLWPRTESLQSTCTKITYQFNSNEETIFFTPQLKSCSGVDNSVSLQINNLFKQLTVTVKTKDCPIGFVLQKATCTCKKSLSLTCDEANTKIIRKEQQWIGVTYQNINPGEFSAVLTYSPCPFDYCRTDNHSLSIHLEDQDVVCAFNRSGILCGGCRANFSRVLGSSKCKECSNNIPVIIAIFLGQVLFGLIVVIALILLDLTVATGTINGLTFYANIIQAQHATFFTQGTAHSFLSFFIARLNLDEGIELCLYDGLDEYAITWLKIPLPLYMWLFAGVLIVLSHSSSRFSKLIGKNVFQVLATLFLISYTRLLQLIINVFTYTSLTYPDGYRKKVWYVDGNVEYFKGKHIPLFFVTVLFLSVSLPYTVILLTIQLLYKISHYHLMFWVQRLKPFFDAYTGPHKAPHRYWTGLLLVVRIILLTIFSTFQSSNSFYNLLFIIVISIALIGWLSLAKGVYESSLNNFLELMFLSNLAITSAVVLVDRQHTKVAIYISTGTAFITFVCIIFYHVVKQLLLTKLGSKVRIALQSVLVLIKNKVGGDTVNNDLALRQTHGQTHTSVTSTTVELKEPLLEDQGDL